MKARVKSTSEIVDVKFVYGYMDHCFETKDGEKYDSLELDFSCDPDYWTRLEHQYAGMAMQGILANYGVEPLPDDAANDAYNYAHALVEMMKQEREG